MRISHAFCRAWWYKSLLSYYQTNGALLSFRQPTNFICRWEFKQGAIRFSKTLVSMWRCVFYSAGYTMYETILYLDRCGQNKYCWWTFTHLYISHLSTVMYFFFLWCRSRVTCILFREHETNFHIETLDHTLDISKLRQARIIYVAHNAYFSAAAQEKPEK